MRILLAVYSALVALPCYAGTTSGGADGESLVQSCTSCHGVDGRGGEAIPALAGRSQEELMSLMQALSKPDAEATIMPRILREYDADEMQAIAAWFAGVKP